MELPHYRSHKVVQAIRIEYVRVLEPGARGAMLTPYDASYPAFQVNHVFVIRNQPYPGGYYIRYKDGYESFSPAGAFEDSYERV